MQLTCGIKIRSGAVGKPNQGDEGRIDDIRGRISKYVLIQFSVTAQMSLTDVILPNSLSGNAPRPDGVAFGDSPFLPRVSSSPGISEGRNV